MRKLFAVVLAITLAAPALSPAQNPDKKPEGSLKVGDAPPPLKATKWLQGTEVKSFEKDKVYVVEFWATWCGPCIVMMPHMSGLQEEYKDKGVTFIGFSAKDPNNSQEKVTQFVERRGPKLKYTFAYADDRATYDAWMTASGQRGIPCCFVVDKETKIAFIGHPMYLDEVLPKVVDGKWTKDDVAAISKVEPEVKEVFDSFQGEAEAGLKKLAEFEKNHPKLADIPYFKGPKLGMLLKAKKTDEARAYAEKLIAKATKAHDSGALQSVSVALRGSAAGDKELAAVFLKAAEGLLKLNGEKDAIALFFVAEAHFSSGNKAKAREFGAKAVAEAASPQLKSQIEGFIKKYND